MAQAAGKRQNVWQFEYFMARRLVWWAAISFSVGVPLIFMEPALKGFGLQGIIWGLIDAGLAVWGSYLTTTRYKSHTSPSAAGVAEIELRKLRKILALGMLIYGAVALAGVIVMALPGRKYAFWLGSGLGLLVQGLGLVGFAAYHVKAMTEVKQS